MDTRLFALLGCLLTVVACVVLGACAVVNQPRFGKLPKGEHLDRIGRSPNYRDGQFHNLIPTPRFSQDDNFISLLWSIIFDKAERLVPDDPIPVVKTDLKEFSNLSFGEDTVVWLGHSSWLIQLEGKWILIDPILSDHAAPFSFLNKAFTGTTIYTAEDMPVIDCLLISHDHWDHLDYSTVTALESKVKQVICPLGVGMYFQYWGYPKEKIREGDWNTSMALTQDVVVHVLPARHYSRRLFNEKKTLWAGFAIETADRKIFYSGDSGYGAHFSEIGKKFNGFDLVLLDCGQYDPRWAYIHMTPEEASRAAVDLQARAIMPSHVGRFTIASHPWDEPFKRLEEESRDKSYQLLTPKIGQPMVMDGELLQTNQWWIEEEQFQATGQADNNQT